MPWRGFLSERGKSTITKPRIVRGIGNLKGIEMKKTMFEVNWHYMATHEDVDEDGAGRFSHCTVTTIQVIREGVLPGCAGVSITAIDINGRQFQGNPGNYHDTESAAWGEVYETLEGMVRENENTIAKLTTRNTEVRKYLENIRGVKTKKE